MERGLKPPETVDNSVETVYNMLYIRVIIQKLQKFYTIRFLFPMGTGRGQMA